MKIHGLSTCDMFNCKISFNLACFCTTRASLVAQLVKNLPVMRRPGLDPWVGKIPWRRERIPTPVFWPGEFHGLYSPWGCKELDMTERLSHTHTHTIPMKSPGAYFYRKRKTHFKIYNPRDSR